MRTFIENYLHFMKNCIRPHYEKLKLLKSGFIENSNFENNRDPCREEDRDCEQGQHSRVRINSTHIFRGQPSLGHRLEGQQIMFLCSCNSLFSFVTFDLCLHKLYWLIIRGSSTVSCLKWSESGER